MLPIVCVKQLSVQILTLPWLENFNACQASEARSLTLRRKWSLSWACSAALSSQKQSLPLKVILPWAEECSDHIQQSQLLPYGCAQQLTHMP